MRIRRLLVCGLALGFCLLPGFAAGQTASQVVTREIASRHFAQNKMGVSAVRRIAVYLPAGYERAAQRYPVIYFFPSPFDGYRSLFETGGAQAIFDRAIARGAIGAFVLVSVEMTTPLGSSWYANSPVTGGWEDFVVDELVPYVDAQFRTVATRDARGLLGQHMGAYGALRIGMRHTDVFGTLYGMNPVGAGSGVQIMDSRPDWEVLAHARSVEELKKDGFATIFASIFQAFLPDTDRPPLYVDLPAHREGKELVIDAALTARLRANFFLESMIPQYAGPMKTLRGLKFDWSRNDAIWDHVYSNQALTHTMNEFGVKHQAEEFNGLWESDAYWGMDGRVMTTVLPFFAQHLAF